MGFNRSSHKQMKKIFQSHKHKKMRKKLVAITAPIRPKSPTQLWLEELEHAQEIKNETLQTLQELPLADLDEKECQAMTKVNDEDSYLFIEKIPRNNGYYSDEDNEDKYQYDVNRFECLLHQIALKEKFTNAGSEKSNGAMIFTRYLSENKTIALFATVKDRLEDLHSRDRIIPLDDALSAYSASSQKAEILIIPIVSLHTRHYRLIMVDTVKNQAIYYDSQPHLWKDLMELKVSGISAIINYFSNMNTEKNHNDNTLSWLYEEAKKILELFWQSYSYVESSFEKFFPSILLSSQGLGSQWNNYDCGMYVALYAECIFQGKLPSDLGTVNPQHCRLAHTELVNQTSMDKTYEEYLGSTNTLSFR